MRVDICSDIVCPWYYAGKARFDKALSGFGHRDEVGVGYHSFELDPAYPWGKRDEATLGMLSRKSGRSAEAALAADGRVPARAGAGGLGSDSGRPAGSTRLTSQDG